MRKLPTTGMFFTNCVICIHSLIGCPCRIFPPPPPAPSARFTFSTGASFVPFERRAGEPSLEARLPCKKAFICQINMADDELEAIRAKRLEEMQTQYGVRFFKQKYFHFNQCLMCFIVTIRDKMRHKCSNNKRQCKGRLEIIILRHCCLFRSMHGCVDPFYTCK